MVAKRGWILLFANREFQNIYFCPTSIKTIAKTHTFHWSLKVHPLQVKCVDKNHLPLEVCPLQNRS